MRPVVLLLLVMFIQPLVDACPTNGTLLALCQCDDSHGGVLLNCSGRDAATVIAALRDNRAQLGLIQQLSLQHSNMRELSANFLAGLYVKKLDFSHNLLTHIDASAFRGLQTVLQDFVAHHNQLYRVPADALNGISSLLNLDLSNNSIGDLDVTQAFVNVPKVSQCKYLTF
jgi:Leucine-rich repeat (LRR) protein